ncbi:MAG: DUF4135 domain-containing protein [Pseudomonadota bacterium]
MSIYDDMVEGVVGPLVKSAAEVIDLHASNLEVIVGNLPAMSQHIQSVLEGCLIDFIAYDLYEFDQGHILAGHSRLPEVGITGVQKLERYLFSKTREGGSFQDYLFGQYPELQEKLVAIQGNLIKSLSTTISRIVKDQEVITSAFFPEVVEPRDAIIRASSMTTSSSRRSSNTMITEINIDFSGKEFHRGQQQVLIVRCKTNEGSEAKFIYKPSSLVADTFLVGDVEKLRELKMHYSDRFEGEIDINASVVQLINAGILPTSPRLQTYLVVPMRWSTVTDSYGYIEFLEHDPAVSSSITDNLQGLLLNAKTKQEADRIIDEFSHAVEGSVAREFQNILQELYEDFQRGRKVHSITSDPQEVKDYSILCGQLAAIFRAFNIADMHVDNIFVHNKKPCAIDFEFCMSLSVASLQETSALTLLGGAFSPFSQTFIHWKFLCPVQDNAAASSLDYAKIEGKEFFYGNNRLYQADIEANRLSPILAEREQFLAGFHQVMNFFRASHLDITGILASNFVRSGFVRVAPLTTADFASMEKNVFGEMMKVPGHKTMMEYRAERFQQWVNNVAEKKIERDAQSNCCLPCQPPMAEQFIVDTARQPPIFLAFDHYAFQELKTNNVPCYYMSFIERGLICGDGHCAEATLAEKTVLSNLLSRDVNEPPHMHVTELDKYCQQRIPCSGVMENFQLLASAWFMPDFITRDVHYIEGRSSVFAYHTDQLGVTLQPIENHVTSGMRLSK